MPAPDDHIDVLRVEFQTVAHPLGLFGRGERRAAAQEGLIDQLAMYRQARALMQRPAAEAIVRANQELHKQGYGLLIHDAYRPWYVTRMFWDATPEPDRIFVADPSQGSRHNRGCAVDLTMYELATGRPVQMVGVYDEMSRRSYPFYPGGTSKQRWLRALLRHAMEEQGFTVYETEWWHFDFYDWQSYPILNLTFEQIDAKSEKR